MRLVIDLPEEVYTDIHDNYIGRDVLFLGVKCGCFLETGLQMKWIPIKMRDMTDEEIQDYEDRFGPSIGDEDHRCFDCRMPEDGQEILISTRWGVEKDICTYDFEYGYGLETNDDWDGVDAWMPCPEKYKEKE